MTPSRESVLSFADQCAWAWIVYQHHQKLFASGPDRLTLLERTAPHFFVDLQNILHEYVLLQICRLTDHDSKSLNVNSVLREFDEVPTVHRLLVPHAVAMNEFRKLIDSARNKVISHADREVIVSGTVLGAFPAGLERAFWDDLQEFLNVVHDHVLGGPYPILDMVMRGDADDLIAVLSRGHE